MIANFKPASTPTRTLSHALPQLIAQRGNAAEFPENTLPALRSALELGIKHIEFDVQLSVDGVPVVTNRRSLMRANHSDLCIVDLSAAELAHITVNEPARFGKKFADVGIPTLTQAAELLATFPAATAFVDIQSISLQHYGYDNAIYRVCECLRAISNQIVLISSDLLAVETIRRRTDYRTGWILPDYSRLSALKSEAIAPEYLFCDHLLLPCDHSRLWRGPWHWAIGEVDSRLHALQLGARGAAFVQTTAVRSLLREMRHIRSGP